MALSGKEILTSYIIKGFDVRRMSKFVICKVNFKYKFVSKIDLQITDLPHSYIGSFNFNRGLTANSIACLRCFTSRSFSLINLFRRSYYT